jgi:hypothetical protein
MAAKARRKPAPPQGYTIRERRKQLLFANWVQNLVGERLGPVTSWQGSPDSDFWEFKLNDDRAIRVEIKAPSFRVKVDRSQKDRLAVREIVEEARQNTEALNLGLGVWYKTRFSSEVPILSPIGQLHFMRLLSEHPRRRLNGPVRFSNDVLLEFDQKDADPGPIALPNFTVDVTLRAAGPGPGPFTQLASLELATIVRAVLAYSTAAPLVHSYGSMSFPAKPEAIESAQRHLSNPAVGEIRVDGIVLAPRIFDDFSLAARQSGNPELLRRLQGGLYSYEQAMHQESEYLALILLVTAIEALTVPNVHGWEQKRLVTRFSNFVHQAAPGAIDEIMSHGNFKQAFGGYSSSRRFLSEVYGHRSRPLHTGFVPHMISGPLVNFGREGEIRVALVSELFRACAKSFLEAPFSSLIGHPTIAPGPDE